MDMKLTNKVAVVTGGASGVGLRCAEMLIDGGAKVALVDNNNDRLEQSVKLLQNKGVAKSYELDVTNIPNINPTVKRIRKEIGEIDILICCAGTNGGLPCAAADISEELWDNILSVNTKGLFFCNQAVVRQSMIPRKTGAIVNIASDVGIVAVPMVIPYITSKAGVVQLTKGEAVEWAPYNIRVNAVAPCWIMTEMQSSFFARVQNIPEFKASQLARIPLNRFATVDEVAVVICFLASELASMVTGAIIPVDGGVTTK
jgi:NAD(P)-dependent dehydrogenase (short-subunit alcohol dehydrogenase family)